jgi:hypothetical protein
MEEFENDLSLDARLENVRKAAEEVCEWLATPEGRAAIEKVANTEDPDSLSEKLRRARDLSKMNLNERMTI